MKKSLTVASLVMGIGGLVVFIFSFLDFYSAGDEGRNAWSGDLLFPATIIPVILGVAMLVFVILDLVGVKLPDKVLTFTWPQIYATWGIAAAGIMLGWIFTAPFSLDRGAGLWLMFIGALAMGVDSIMNLLGLGANTINIPTGGGTPSSTTQPPAAGGAYPPSYPPSAPTAPPPPPPSGGTPPPPPPPA